MLSNANALFHAPVVCNFHLLLNQEQQHIGNGGTFLLATRHKKTTAYRCATCDDHAGVAGEGVAWGAESGAVGVAGLLLLQLILAAGGHPATAALPRQADAALPDVGRTVTGCGQRHLPAGVEPHAVNRSRVSRVLGTQ